MRTLQVTRLPFGPNCLFFKFSNLADGGLASARRAVIQWLEAEPPAEMVEYVPGIDTVLLEFAGMSEPELERLGLSLAARFERLELSSQSSGRIVEIPVAYDGVDLARVAEFAKLSTAEVICLHSSTTYEVAVMGFSPGFAYLEGLDSRLQVPRLPNPRPRVSAGAVAIGGMFTGVYPQATPGGWNLIGKTDLVLFDPRREPVSLLQPGDKVRFTALC